ncbi:Ankyrin repeat-containing protein [Candidatus Megaera venefica]|uniref:Ankyrin repeat-containing protein n=1 Tax=Candidatus Megaera venefica TaxID=2055910 RepID=A0ABU5NAM2_9RICK|nr:ankyrin repeat domain-containing protein [Candidatus Megaera venefica]MEA0970213.1 Ankyrin repeat-containing protein [Candidatus Megaera venefica]
MTKVNCSLDILMITVSEENVNARDSHGWAPIHYAAGFGEIKFIKGLVSLAADLNLYTTETAESKSLTPIIAAIKNGQVKALNQLLTLGAKSELKVDDSAPLMYAIRHKTLAPELTSALIVNGADISQLKEIIEKLGAAMLTILEVQEELIEKIVSAVNGNADQILEEYLGRDDISVIGNENKKEKIEKETDEFIGIFSDFTSKETYDLWLSGKFLEDSSDSF